jgi:hypothetical protein
MSDRQRALKILREAREILAQRLSELVLEQAEAILADARGDSYLSEIESLYDQVGMKLAHVGQMLAHLPGETAERPAAGGKRPRTSGPHPVATRQARPQPLTEEAILALTGPRQASAPALPPPGGAHSARARATQLSLQTFAAQIQAGDVPAAGRTIGALLELDESRAIACAARFAQQVQSEAGFFRRMMQLRGQVQAGDNQRVLALLVDCFGLSQREAATVVQTLRRRLRLEK